MLFGGLYITQVNVFMIIPEFRIWRLTFQKVSLKMLNKADFNIMASLIYFQFILGQFTILFEIINDL